MATASLAPAIAARNGKPVNPDELLFDFVTAGRSIREIVTEHNLALRTFADWIDRADTRAALDRLRALMARQAEAAAPGLAHLANTALATIVEAATAAPETIRRAAADLLRGLRTPFTTSRSTSTSAPASLAAPADARHAAETPLAPTPAHPTAPVAPPRASSTPPSLTTRPGAALPPLAATPGQSRRPRPAAALTQRAGAA